MKQFVLTPSMSKRLLAMAVAVRQDVRDAAQSGTLVIVAGTTNAYVAQEVLDAIGQADGFVKQGFRRGMVLPPGGATASTEGKFTGDVVIREGKWQPGLEIFDVIDSLQAGDMVIKGANAVNVEAGEAGVFIGDDKSGTIGAAIPAVIGRRVKLLVPVGLEKRVDMSILEISRRLVAADVEGPRMMPMPGEVVTELDALAELAGADVWLIGGGGVYGAEGAVWLAVDGDEQEIEAASELCKSLASEGPCEG